MFSSWLVAFLAVADIFGKQAATAATFGNFLDVAAPVKAVINYILY
jgi:hypothetical protein